jgi:vitamin B12 transporter
MIFLRPLALRATALAVALGVGASPFTSLAQPSPGRAEDTLEEIVVISSRIETPLREIGTAVSVIDRAEIDLRGYDALADLLRAQPGIGVSNSGGYGQPTAVRVRGEESYRTLVMIDGVEVSDPTGTQVGPDFSHLLTTNDIQRIEILRGPQGFIYGADAGGIINILTRSGENGVGGQASLEYGDFDTARLDANLSGGSDSGDFFVAVTDIDSEGFNTRATDSVLMDDDGYENTTLHTKVGWSASETLRLQLVARDVDARTEFDQCGFPTTHDCIADTRQTTYRLSADYRSGNLTHLVAYSNTDIARASFADGLDAFSTSGDLSRAEYTGSFRPSDAATLVYGLELEEEDILTGDGERMSRDQNAVFFELQGRFQDRFFVTAGARRDDNDDFGRHSSVRVTAAYLVDLGDGSTLKYRAGYGTGFRAPSLSEIAYNTGPFAFPPASDVILSEESSGGYDLGVEYARESGLSIEAGYFDQEIEDEIFFDLSGFSGYLQSAGFTRSRGVELAARIPVTSRWTVLGNVTLNDTEDGAGLERIRRPRTLANVSVSYTSAGEALRVLGNLRLSGDAQDEIFGVGRVPLASYEALDVSASYRWRPNLELFGRIENLTDEDYEEVAGFLTGGRTASAGVRLSF